MQGWLIRGRILNFKVLCPKFHSCGEEGAGESEGATYLILNELQPSNPHNSNNTKLRLNTAPLCGIEGLGFRSQFFLTQFL